MKGPIQPCGKLIETMIPGTNIPTEVICKFFAGHHEPHRGKATIDGIEFEATAETGSLPREDYFDVIMYIAGKRYGGRVLIDRNHPEQTAYDIFEICVDAQVELRERTGIPMFKAQ